MSGAAPFRTGRLVLRPPRLADVPALFAFLGDAAAMRHTHADATLRDCRRRVAAHEWQRRQARVAPCVAPWAVLTAEGRLVGWGGLYRDPFEPGWGVELGYHFHPAAWGRGYATELALFCVRHADAVLRLHTLTAFAHPANGASRRVLHKVGFAVVRHVPEMDRLLFRRERPAPPQPEGAPGK